MSENIYNNTFLKFNIDDVSLLYSNMAEVALQLNNEENYNIYKSKHEQVFGHLHKRSKKIIDMKSAFTKH